MKMFAKTERVRWFSRKRNSREKNDKGIFSSTLPLPSPSNELGREEGRIQQLPLFSSLSSFLYCQLTGPTFSTFPLLYLFSLLEVPVYSQGTPLVLSEEVGYESRVDTLENNFSSYSRKPRNVKKTSFVELDPVRRMPKIPSPPPEKRKKFQYRYITGTWHNYNQGFGSHWFNLDPVPDPGIFLIADPDPQGIDDQKFFKFKADKIIYIFLIKNFNLLIPRPP